MALHSYGRYALDAHLLMAGGPAPTRNACRVAPLGGLAPAGEPAEVRVYPNPSATGVFWLTGAAGATATVVDARGRVVRRQAVTACGPPAEPLDLGASPSGLYLLRLTWADGRQVSRKLVR